MKGKLLLFLMLFLANLGRAQKTTLTFNVLAVVGKQTADYYGQIKSNKGFRRFNLRGLEKVKIETGLLAIAHNLQKLAA